MISLLRFAKRAGYALYRTPELLLKKHPLCSRSVVEVTYFVVVFFALIDFSIAGNCFFGTLLFFVQFEHN